MTGVCAAGSNRQVNADGTVLCEIDDVGGGGGGVSAVTASAPLLSSGGAAPDISLPNVIIASTNTAIGTSALSSNTNGANNTATGRNALLSNTMGSSNTATGRETLVFNTTGSNNTATGMVALYSNSTGSFNTAIGYGADVSATNLTNATAIGANAIVNASNKIRLGNNLVTVIEGQVAFTASSDKTKKENFRLIDGEQVLTKLGRLEVTSWNFIGHDAEKFRHYGPMAQDFFAAFGHDGVGQIGTETTINSGDMAGILMIAVQALEQRTAELKEKEARIAALEKDAAQKDERIIALETTQSQFETIAVRLAALELKLNGAVRVKAETKPGDELAELKS